MAVAARRARIKRAVDVSVFIVGGIMVSLAGPVGFLGVIGGSLVLGTMRIILLDAMLPPTVAVQKEMPCTAPTTVPAPPLAEASAISAGGVVAESDGPISGPRTLPRMFIVTDLTMVGNFVVDVTRFVQAPTMGNLVEVVRDVAFLGAGRGYILAANCLNVPLRG